MVVVGGGGGGGGGQGGRLAPAPNFGTLKHKKVHYGLQV